jgi:hypothetical protein
MAAAFKSRSDKLRQGTARDTNFLSGIDERWSIPYFQAVACEVLSPYLTKSGFSAVRRASFNEVLFERHPVRLRVHYLPEEPRPYSPMVSMGFAPRFDASLMSSMIGLWYAMPRNDEAYDYGAWRFDNADELSAVLTRIRDEVIERHARPLWEHPERLRLLLERQLHELKEEQRARVRERAKVDARHAFAAGDYRRAAELYGGLAHSELSGSDLRRLEIARARSR